MIITASELPAGEQSDLAAKRRRNAAHGASHGSAFHRQSSSEGAEETWPTPVATSYFISSSAQKGRRALIGDDIRQHLFAYLGGIVREMRGTALIINGTADHVHMLVRIRPAQSAAEVVRVVKANSCRWVHEKWKMRFAWQTGYGVFSVSESSVPAVSRYIADQEGHHRTKTFQEEFVAFLKRITSPMMSDICGIDAVVSFAPSGLAIIFVSLPTAGAVGCTMPALRGWGAVVQAVPQ